MNLISLLILPAVSSMEGLDLGDEEADLRRQLREAKGQLGAQT